MRVLEYRTQTLKSIYLHSPFRCFRAALNIGTVCASILILPIYHFKLALCSEFYISPTFFIIYSKFVTGEHFTNIFALTLLKAACASHYWKLASSIYGRPVETRPMPSHYHVKLFYLPNVNFKNLAFLVARNEKVESMPEEGDSTILTRTQNSLSSSL